MVERQELRPSLEELPTREEAMDVVNMVAASYYHEVIRPIRNRLNSRVGTERLWRHPDIKEEEKDILGCWIRLQDGIVNLTEDDEYRILHPWMSHDTITTAPFTDSVTNQEFGREEGLAVEDIYKYQSVKVALLRKEQESETRVSAWEIEQLAREEHKLAVLKAVSRPYAVLHNHPLDMESPEERGRIALESLFIGEDPFSNTGSEKGNTAKAIKRLQGRIELILPAKKVVEPEVIPSIIPVEQVKQVEFGDIVAPEAAVSADALDAIINYDRPREWTEKDSLADTKTRLPRIPKWKLLLWDLEYIGQSGGHNIEDAVRSFRSGLYINYGIDLEDFFRKIRKSNSAHADTIAKKVTDLGDKLKDRLDPAATRELKKLKREEALKLPKSAERYHFSPADLAGCLPVAGGALLTATALVAAIALGSMIPNCINKDNESAVKKAPSSQAVAMPESLRGVLPVSPSEIARDRRAVERSIVEAIRQAQRDKDKYEFATSTPIDLAMFRAGTGWVNAKFTNADFPDRDDYDQRLQPNNPDMHVMFYNLLELEGYSIKGWTERRISEVFDPVLAQRGKVLEAQHKNLPETDERLNEIIVYLQEEMDRQFGVGTFQSMVNDLTARTKEETYWNYSRENLQEVMSPFLFRQVIFVGTDKIVGTGRFPIAVVSENDINLWSQLKGLDGNRWRKFWDRAVERFTKEPLSIQE